VKARLGGEIRGTAAAPPAQPVPARAGSGHRRPSPRRRRPDSRPAGETPPGRFFTPPEAIAGRSCPCGECACEAFRRTVVFTWSGDQTRYEAITSTECGVPSPDRLKAPQPLGFPLLAAYRNPTSTVRRAD